MFSLKKRESIILLIFSVFLNLIGRYFASELSLPISLDSVGTLLSAILMGTVGGALAGLLTNLIIGIPDHVTWFYAVVSVAVGASVGHFYPRDRSRELFSVVSTAFSAGFIAVVISTPLNVFLYNGYTGNLWGDALFDLLSIDISIPAFNSFFAEAFVDMPDKAISIILAVIIADIITGAAKKPDLLKIILISFALPGLFAFESNAEDFEADYETVTYDTQDGLDTAEINAIAQTPDGFMWAGTYSGLFRSNGSKFERITLDERIYNVMRLYADSRGCLWIGTNDSGVACYDTATGGIRFYTMDDGLAANAIRGICEDLNGNICIGTVSFDSIITPEGEVTTYDHNSDIYGVQSLTSCGGGLMAGVTNGGTLFFVKDGNLVYKHPRGTDDGIYYTAVGSDGFGNVIAGTSGGEVDKYIVRHGRPVFRETIGSGGLTYINDLHYAGDFGGYFVCAENGMGFWDASDDKVTILTKDGFDSSICDVCVDLQDNIWFGSNKQGMMRFSWNPFDNIFKKAGMDGDVTNALLISGNILYAGTDDGVIAMDLKKHKRLKPDYLKQFKGVRVRHMMEDSAGNIWVSTYGQDGLVCIHPDGASDIYNEKDGTMGGRFRSTIELKDGRIFAAGNMGLSIIDKGVVTATIGEKDGLYTPQILSMYEKEDGSVLAASDGDGIYIIKDDRITGHIGTEEGLETLVVLRVVPCSDGFIYVTSNALYHDDGASITRLDSFPYSNNYDIFITDDGMCWITSSAGLYIVREEDLLANGDYRYVLLNRNRGFSTTFTANAWNGWDGSLLYLCCTDGMRRISPDNYNSFDEAYPIDVSGISAEDQPVKKTDGRYIIPAVTGRIRMEVAVLNYTFSNPLLHVYLKGSGDEGMTCFQNELAPLTFNKLPGGDYELCVQVLDEKDGSVIREEQFTVKKEALMYEKLYFKLYLMFVCVMLLVFLGWYVGNLRQNAARVRGLQKEVAMDSMTGLYNKNASIIKLKELCQNTDGTLLTIDLDSFKLVNDIYGHGMGDRILIRFSQLITSAIGEGNLAGRMGGDEFIAYVKGECDNERMEAITRMLNEELLISAREYMGEDMEIPLGASIGAIKVPDDEGKRDFGGLFHKADKALYMVKQNGKHGYSFYRKNAEEKKLLDDGASIRKLMTIMGERGEGKGAYFLELDEMQIVYRYFVRYARRRHSQIHLVRLTIKDNARGEDVIDIPEPIIEGIGELVADTLRETDIMTRNGRQYLVLLTVRNEQECIEVINRILSAWSGLFGSDDYSILYEMERLKTMPDDGN